MNPKMKKLTVAKDPTKPADRMSFGDIMRVISRPANIEKALERRQQKLEAATQPA